MLRPNISRYPKEGFEGKQGNDWLWLTILAPEVDRWRGEMGKHFFFFVYKSWSSLDRKKKAFYFREDLSVAPVRFSREEEERREGPREFVTRRPFHANEGKRPPDARRKKYKEISLFRIVRSLFPRREKTTDRFTSPHETEHGQSPFFLVCVCV